MDLYNTQYAAKNNLSEIDANASASPMKIIQNVANVLGLTAGGLLLGIAGYTGFFVLFGAGLLALAGASIFYRLRIRV